MTSRSPRHENWSRLTLLEELRRDSSIPVKGVVEKYVIPGASAKTLQKDIIRWRREDPDFRIQYENLLESRTQRSQAKVARRKKYSNWKKKFRDAYLRTGSKKLSLQVTPFKSVMSIHRRLDPNNALYDAELAQMVADAEEAVNHEAEEIVLAAMRDPELTSAQRAQIALKWLQSRSSHRWGRKTEITGTFKHDHQHSLKEAAIKSLWEDQQSFFNRPPEKLLGDGGDGDREVEDAEVIDAEYQEVAS